MCGRNKDFLKEKWKEFVASRPASNEMLKDVFLEKKINIAQKLRATEREEED